MNRTDRLHALSEELRRAGPAGRTSGQLAALLEVSVRTVKRDVDALQQAGLPVWAQSGPGGGYVLDATASLPPVNLTAAQATAVAVALALDPSAPFGTDGRAALAKVLDALDPTARRRAERLSSRVWVRDGHRDDPRVLRVLEQALDRQVVVVLSYVDAHGAASRRPVEPQLLARMTSHWFLAAWCRTKDAPRWFRVDRVRAAHLTTTPSTDRDVGLFGDPPHDARAVGVR